MLSKRKRPRREDKPLNERSKIAGYVLDDKTVGVIIHYLNARLIKSMDYPISSGKESVVFRATKPDGTFLAVKVYKYETSSFHHMAKYIEGDSRFRVVKHQIRPLVQEWARKEFANLHKATEAKARVPLPIAQRQNVVFMSFEGVEGKPFALLKDVVLSDPKKTYHSLVLQMQRFHKAGLIHADLSEYNILIDSQELPIIIDVGQSVLLGHPRSKEFLQSDCNNVARFFFELGVQTSPEAVMKKVTG